MQDFGLNLLGEDSSRLFLLSSQAGGIQATALSLDQTAVQIGQNPLEEEFPNRLLRQADVLPTSDGTSRVKIA